MEQNLFVQKDNSSTTDFIIEQIKKLLMNGTLKPGDRLPSEFELADSLGVSRGSVRSAMKVFEAYGIIQIRRGDGTYISKSITQNAMNPLLFSLLILNPSMEDMGRFREKIELDIVELIRKDDDKRQAILPMLEANLNELDKLHAENADIEALVKNDIEFHMILADHCGNPIFEAVYKYIMEFFGPFIKDSHKYQMSGEYAQEAHRPIYDALKNGSYSVAKDAIIKSMQIWYKSLEKE